MAHNHHAPNGAPAPEPAPTAGGPFAAISNNAVITKVFGTSKPVNTKVSESLDYEPVQNKLFLDRMKAGKGEKKIYGCVVVWS